MNNIYKTNEISHYLNVIIDDILKPCFNFGKYSKSTDIDNWFAALLLNKINSLFVSMDNSLKLKDTHLSTYIYRYIYELHLKTAFLFIDKSKVEQRINNLNNLKIKNCYSYLKENNYEFILSDNDKHYEMLSNIIHPNIESFTMHIDNTQKEEFEFIYKNIGLSLIFIKQILLILKNNDLINLNKNLDLQKIDEINKKIYQLIS